MASVYLPKNRTVFEQAVADAAAFREINPDVIRTLYDVDQCFPEFLPYLGWAFAVDFWELAVDDDQRRDLIRNAITWHRKRGTPWSIKAALAAFGYPVLQLIEQAEYHRQWIAAGGRVLDGTWQTNGTVTLDAPGTAVTGQLVRRVALNHWAEYAIRLDAAAGIWTREHQRKIRMVAESFAPERSHLARLIAGIALQFDAQISMTGPSIKLAVSFNRCQRFKPVDRLMLDGCWKLDGGYVALGLDGWSLDGRALNGRRPVGRMLERGHLTFNSTIRLSLGMHLGGAYHDPPVSLGNAWRTLDGRWYLNDPLLRGWPLTGGLKLGDNRLNRLAIPHLDGTWLLGGLRGGPGIQFDGVVRVRSAGITTQEPFMSTPQTTPVTHAYRNHVATTALSGGALSKAAFMAFSESDKPYSPEEDTDLPGEFVRVPIEGKVTGPNLKVVGLLTGELAGERVVRGVAVFTDTGLLMGRRVLKPKELEQGSTMEIDITFTY